MRVEALVVAVGIGLLFPIQFGLDRTRGAPPNIITTLPPVRLLPALAMGHRETAADLLEIKATNFLFKGITGQRAFSERYRDHMWSLYEAILELDPKDADAAWRGGLLMGAVCNRPDDAIAMMRRALGLRYLHAGKVQPAREGVPLEHPRRWRLFHEQASTYFLMHANRTFGEQRRDYIRQAGKLWIQATEAGAPGFYREVGEKLARQEISEEESLRHEKLIWEYRFKSGTERTRALALEHLAEIQAAYTRLELQRLVDRLREAGRPIRSLKQLRVQIPPNPLGGTYGLKDGRVIAPRVEARRLQRLLAYRFRVYRHEHPDAVPTVADLLKKRPLPDYLEVRVSAAGVVVRPKS